MIEFLRKALDMLMVKNKSRAIKMAINIKMRIQCLKSSGKMMKTTH